MSKYHSTLYTFSGFSLNTSERLLTHDGQPVGLTPKAFDVLSLLIHRSGRLVTKADLLATVWGDAIVEDGNLVVTVSMLRKALGVDGKSIQTVSKYGYRFVGVVHEVALEEATGGAPGSDDETEAQAVCVAPGIQYLRRDIGETDSEEPGGAAVKSFDPHDAQSIAPIREIVGKDTPAHALTVIVGNDEFASVSRTPATPASRSLWPLKPTLGRAIIAAALLLPIGWQLRSGIATREQSEFVIDSMAVLPFKNLTGNHQNDYLGLAIADGVIAGLGSLGKIAVRPTAAVLKYDIASMDALAAGRDQHVNAILEGRVREPAGGLQVDVQLIRVKDGRSLWAGVFQADEDRPVTSQSISDHIVRAILEELPRKHPASTTHNTTNGRALKLYMEGRQSFWDQRREDAIRQSISYFQQAIAEDPNDALAYSGMADSYTRMAAYSSDPAGLTPTLAKTAALRGLQLGGSFAEVHASLGFISFSCDWDWKAAEREFQRALTINPSYNPTRHWYGATLAAEGDLGAALKQFRQAVEFDPLSARTHADLAWGLYLARQYEPAILENRKAIQLDPNFAQPRKNLGLALAQTGAFADSLRELTALQRLVDAHTTGAMGVEAPYLIEYVRALAGNRTAARRALTSLTEHGQVRPFSAALVCLALGDRNCALDWLDLAYAAHNPSMVYIRTNPSLDGLQMEPRFVELVKRMGA